LILLGLIFFSSLCSFLRKRSNVDTTKNFNDLFPEKAWVIREGNRTRMESKNIVPGDLIEIYPKERIPADIRIIKCDDMTVNNFVITGKHSGFDLNALPSTEKPLEAKNLAF